jgi:riboflavin kinase/FMN adenylyltransferase
LKSLVLRGKVVPGAGLGRRLGFPTANVVIPAQKLPPYGVYRAEAVWGAFCLPAVCNVGVRPTLGPSGEILVEVHVLDFDGDLYGQELEVRFLEKIRDEKRFDSLSELVDQIRKDAEAVRKAGLRPQPE